MESLLDFILVKQNFNGNKYLYRFKKQVLLIEIPVTNGPH
jgi:hypothetical protein